jgi:hypothetical protein
MKVFCFQQTLTAALRIKLMLIAAESVLDNKTWNLTVWDFI